MEPDTKPDTGPLCIALVELGPSVALHVRCSIPLQQWTLTDGTCNVLARCTVQRVFGQNTAHAKTAKSANLNETGRRDEDHFLVDKMRKRGSKGTSTHSRKVRCEVSVHRGSEAACIILSMHDCCRTSSCVH